MNKFAEFRLLVEGATDGDPPTRNAGELPMHSSGDGVLALAVDDLAPVQPDAAERSVALRFEALAVEHSDALLMLAPPRLDVRVNGLPAPRITVLEVADQVQLAGAVLHVTRYQSSATGPPAPEHIGRRCPICSVEIDADTRVHVHACGALLHAEEPGSKPEADLLQCAQLGTCPDCDSSVALTTGLTYTPEL
jgi:hypothetical protein